MRKMKDSGIAWIGEIPQEWEISKVKYQFICKDEKAHLENPVVLSLARSGVKIRDLTTNEGQIAASYYDYNPVEIGDLLLNPMDLYSGANCSLSNVCGVISPAYINLRANKGSVPRYYDYFFKTQYWSMAFFAHGKGISFDNRWTLGFETLMNYYLPLPPLPEQQAIADKLDKVCGEIDKVIAKTKAVVEEYKKLKQAIITEAVTGKKQCVMRNSQCGIKEKRPMKDSGIAWIGEIPQEWEVRRFKSLGKCRNGLTYSPNNLTDKDSGTLVLRSSNIKNGKLIFQDNVYVNCDCSNTYVKKNDILICSRNGSVKLIGKNALIEDDIKAAFGAFMMIFRCKKPKYVRYILNSNVFLYNLASFLTSTVNQLTVENFENIKCPFPNDDIVQQAIVAYLDTKCGAIDEVIAKKQQLIAEMENYKKSVIYEYVTGKKEVG